MDNDKIWTEEKAKAFIGRSLKKDDTACDSNGIPYFVPRAVRSMSLKSIHVREALQAAAESKGGDVTLIVGPGGSGKSLVYKAIAHSVGRPLCLAPTGVAALNLVRGGWAGIDYDCHDIPAPVTINKGLHLQITDYVTIDMGDDAVASLKDDGWTHILVDEVSMVNPNMLDLLMYTARKLDIPLLLFGDPMQLPPVEKSLPSFLAEMYPGWRFFDSYFWMLQHEDKLRMIMLDSVYRQSDPGFKSLLNRARVGEMTKDDEALLRTREVAEPPAESLVLCFRNGMAQEMNRQRQGKYIPTVTCDGIFNTIVKADGFCDRIKVEFDEHNIFKDKKLSYSDEALLLLPRENGGPDCFTWEEESGSRSSASKSFEKSSAVMRDIELFPGDRVMITRNMDVPDIDMVGCRLLSIINNTVALGMSLIHSMFPLGNRDHKTCSVVNGTMGTYLGVCNALAENQTWWDVKPYKDTPKFVYETLQKRYREEPDEGSYLMVRLDDGHTVLVPQVRFTADRLEMDGTMYETSAVWQFPIRLAFAITYHKSQGLTLDKVHMILEPDDPMPPGLGYLGLSRCRTLEGLTMNRFVPGAFRCDEQSKVFLKRLDDRLKPFTAEERNSMRQILHDLHVEKDQFTLPGVPTKFDYVYSAYCFSFIKGTEDWTMKDIHAYKGIIREDMANLGLGLFKNNSEKLDAISEKYGLPKLEYRSNPQSVDWVRLMYAKLVELHPELNRLLLRAGEPGIYRDEMIAEWTSTKIDGIWLSKFFFGIFLSLHDEVA